jgi:hypothetical protein
MHPKPKTTSVVVPAPKSVDASGQARIYHNGVARPNARQRLSKFYFSKL